MFFFQKVKFITLAMVLSMFVFTGCGKGKASTVNSSNEKDLTIEGDQAKNLATLEWIIGPSTTEDNDIDNELILKLKEYPSDQEDLIVKVKFSMPQCCDQCVAYPVITPTADENGNYQLKGFRFTMHGLWKVEIKVYEQNTNKLLKAYSYDITF